MEPKDSPRARKMLLNSYLLKAYPQEVSRKKLIAPFQKRPPSHERAQGPGRIREPQAQSKNSKTILYDMIKSSPQINSKRTKENKDLKERDGKENEVKVQGRFTSECKGIKYRDDSKGRKKRFLSRKDYLNISKKRANEMPKKLAGGSKLKERIQKFLYKPTAVTTNKAIKKTSSYSFSSKSLLRGELYKNILDVTSKRIPPA